MKYLTNKDSNELATFISYYLSETVMDLSDWDCEHLAINMLNELKIVKPSWWDNRFSDTPTEKEEKLDELGMPILKI